MIARLLATLLVVGGLAAASDPFQGLAFPDGKPRALADFHGESVIAVWFCAH